MAKSLRIEIALAGTEEVNRQLKSMDETGVKAFNNIAAAAKKVGGFAKLDEDTIGKIAAKAGVTGKEALDQLNKAIETKAHFEKLADAVGLVEKALGRAGLAAKALLLVFTPLQAAALVIATLLGVALVVAAIKAAQAIAALERQAIGLGTTFEKLSKLKTGLGAAGIPFDAVSQGLQKLQGDIDKFNLEKVERAFAEAQKNIAAGWAPSSQQLAVLRKAAESTTPAVRAAGEAALKALGQPINDRVTPILESMVRWAGDAVKAIPLIANEFKQLGTAGERARFMQDMFKAVVADSPDAVSALQNIIKAMDQLPPSAERDKAVTGALGDELGTRLVQAAKQGGTSISDLVESVKGGSQATADSAAKIDLAVNKIKAGFAAAFENIPLDRLSTTLDGAATKVQGFAQAINTISWEGFTTGATTAMATVNPPMQTLQTNVQSIQTSLAQDMWTMFVTGATTALTQVSTLVQQLASLVAGTFSSAWSSAASSAVSSIGQIETALDNLITKINQAITALNNLQSAKSAADSGGEGGGFAGGGLMGGRGSGTSDSNLAWLSRGEHIMPARAVRQPGVLQLLEALRRSGGNLRGVLDRMGHFAAGGMVSAPAFARGGAVGGMSNVTIQFPGVQPISGLRASSAVVDELRRSAALAQVRSGGRKPSRYT